jgi:hypothetical protein
MGACNAPIHQTSVKPFWGFLSGLIIGIAFTAFYFLKKKSNASGNKAVKVIITADKPTEKP